MLVIRMQRTGRKGHAQFRVVVQDSRRTPTSGRIVAALGHYNPHTKEVVVDKEKASFYMEHGAQPTTRVALLLKKEGVKLPDWVKIDTSKQRGIRNADKRRSTRPAEEVEASEAQPSTSGEANSAVEAASEEPVAEETPAETPAEAPVEAEPAAEAEEPAVE